MIFVDTGAWYALMDSGDAQHQQATLWLSRNLEPLVTSDFVVAETLTLFRARKEYTRALNFGREMMDHPIATMQSSTEEDFQQAWRIFRDYSDKSWSFTDCHSKWMMEKLEISTAFAFDRHFRQFGAEVVPGLEQ